jgi:hypothetical protein
MENKSKREKIAEIKTREFKEQRSSSEGRPYADYTTAVLEMLLRDSRLQGDAEAEEERRLVKAELTERGIGRNPDARSLAILAKEAGEAGNKQMEAVLWDRIKRMPDKVYNHKASEKKPLPLKIKNPNMLEQDLEKILEEGFQIMKSFEK